MGEGLTMTLPEDFYEYVSKEEAIPIENGLRLYHLRKAIKEKKFKEIGSKELINILGKTIKRDEINKVLNFQGQLSAYTEDSQLNILHSSPSSTGKSYIPTEIADFFPNEDVVMVGYCSPTSFFHDNGIWNKEDKSYLVDLSRKILIFLDQPHTLLLQHLRPILSHDKKEIIIKITDKSQKHGLKTKKVIIRGYPVVIFCTAGLTLDEQEATRFLLLSPEINQQKIKEAINLKIEADSDKEKFKLDLEKDSERKLLKERILAIKQERIKYIKIDSSLKEILTNNFFKGIKSLKPRHQRDIGRLISLIKTFALLNVWYRKREGNTIYASQSDLDEAFSIWDKISESQELNLPPFVFGVYKEVILKKYGELNRGLSRQDILKGYFDAYGRNLQDWLLRQQILPMLENCGLITAENDSKDKRKIVYTPTTPLTISSNENNSENDGGGDYLNKEQNSKRCIECGSLNANFTQDGKIFYCIECGYKKFGGVSLS